MKYTERIYSESEVKLIEEIFDMAIKQIYDEDLEKLVFECKEMFLEHQKSLKEIERLNNIINEIEKELKDNIDMCDGFIDTTTSDLQELCVRHNGKTYYQTILLENKIALKIYQKELEKLQELKRS